MSPSAGDGPGSGSWATETSYADFTLVVSPPPLPAARGRPPWHEPAVWAAAGLPLLAWAAWGLSGGFPPGVSLLALIALALGAAVGAVAPVRISEGLISLGTGFFVALVLLAGPQAGAALIALTTLAAGPVRWALGRDRQELATGELWIVAGRAVFAAGAAGAAYRLAGLTGFRLFALQPPVGTMDLAAAGAVLVLAGGAYVGQNLLALLLAWLLGAEPQGRLRQRVPAAVLVEFLGLPGGLLLAAVAVRMGLAELVMLELLYLAAVVYGHRVGVVQLELTTRLEHLELVARASRELGATLDLGEVAATLQRVLARLMPFQTMILVLRDPSGGLHQVYAFDVSGGRADLTADDVTETEAAAEGLFAEPGGGAVYIRDVRPEAGSLARLRLDFPPGAVPDQHRQALLDTLCEQAGAALSNARLYWEANTDPLTGLAQRRYFERALRAAAARGEGFAVIMFDLDRFKRINDRHGHEAGDRVLADLASVVEGTLRATDVAARYGGEEFVILLPGTGAAEAAAVAERIRRSLERREVRMAGAVLRYTASFGVAASGDAGGAQDPMRVVWQADEALMAAKEAGRNQVVTWAGLDRDEVAR